MVLPRTFTNRLYPALDRFLAAESYHRCCLAVSRQIDQLEQTAKALQRRYQWQILPVGSVISAALKAVPQARRPVVVATALTERLRSLSPGPVLCTGIDLLFEPSLRLDPLRLLLDASRTVTVVVLWPGVYDGTQLEYAVPEHAHHRVWRRADLSSATVIALDNLR